MNNFGCKWHFPSCTAKIVIEHRIKKCQEKRNQARRIKVSQEDGQLWSCGPSQSLYYILHKWLDMYLVKTWENISSLDASASKNICFCSGGLPQGQRMIHIPLFSKLERQLEQERQQPASVFPLAIFHLSAEKRVALLSSAHPTKTSFQFDNSAYKGKKLQLLNWKEMFSI